MSIEIKQSYISNKITNQNTRNSTIATTPPTYSTFDKSFQQGTTFNSGKLIPVLCQEVYPGDIYEIKTNAIIRLSAPSSTPFMNINFDLNFFFVPYVQIDPDFKKFMGEVESSSDTHLIDYSHLMSVPSIQFTPINNNTGNFHYTENDLANYFNFPINFNFHNSVFNSLPTTKHFKINILPFLAYGKVWNEWYRNQNYESECDITTVFGQQNNTRVIEYNTSNNRFFQADGNLQVGAVVDPKLTIQTGKQLLPTFNFKDYFQNILPSRQKVVNFQPLVSADIINLPLWSTTDPSFFTSSRLRVPRKLQFVQANGQRLPDSQLNKVVSTGTDGTMVNSDNTQNSPYHDLYVMGIPNVGSSIDPITGDNNRDEAGTAISLDLNSFRDNLVLQHFFETLEIAGSRYYEQLNSIWGIEIDPKLINRTQFVGGQNMTLIFNNTQQTSANTNVDNNASLLGNTISSSLYNSLDIDLIKFSGEQHGLLLGLVTARTNINYGSQGIPKMFLYNNFLDFYNPKFNGISDQPIQQCELTLNLISMKQWVNELDSDPTNHGSGYLGYQEPFINLKNNINNSNGYLSQNSSTSLFSQFLFGPKFDKNSSTNVNIPSIIKYDPNTIDNGLFKVTSNTNQFYHQFIALFSFDIKYHSKQPLYTHPGVKYI